MNPQVVRWTTLQVACVLLTSGLLLPAGCGPAGIDTENEEQVASESPEEIVELAESLAVVDDVVGTLVDATQNSLTFAAGSSADSVQIGEFIVSGEATVPFLRRVTDRMVSESGQVTLVTQDAALDELFANVRISRYGTFGEFIPADGVEVNLRTESTKIIPGLLPPAGREVPITNLDLTVKLTDNRAEGSINVKLSTSALLELESTGWLPPKLNRVKTSISSDYEFGVGLSMKALQLLDRCIPLGRLRVLFMIGVVPVYGELDLALKVEADLKGAVAVAFKGHVEAGGEWTRSGGWQRILEHQPLVGEGKAQAQASIQALASVQLSLYRIAGPMVAFGPALTAAVNFTNLCNLDYELAMKVEAGIDFGKALGDEELAGKSLGYELKEPVTAGTLKLCDADKPNAPTRLSAVVDGRQPPAVTLSWTDNSPNEASFLVQWSDGGDWQGLAYLAKDTTTYSHTTPSPGLDNLYQVYAVGPEGTLSDASNIAVVSLDGLTPPAAPESLAAECQEDRLVTLAWVDGSDDEEGFIIERSSASSGFLSVGRVDREVTAFSDPTVLANEVYTYRVFAYNAAGDSPYSNEVSVETKLFNLAQTAAPAAPSGLGAAVTADGDVQLCWTDHSSREDGFVIERADDGAAWAERDLVGEDASAYLDRSPPAGTTYTYRVRAFNDAGFSDYSNTVTVEIGEAGEDGSNEGEDDEPDGGNGSDDGPEWLIWYTGNVDCWGAPQIYAGTRTSFEAWQSTASVPGGGRDTTEELIKVEMQGGFASQQEALDWLCPQFTSRFSHYWCGTQYYMNGSYWMVARNLCSNLGDLPRDEEKRAD